MTIINTVRGPIADTELGVTLMHEHVFVMNPEMVLNYDDFDERERQDEAVKMLDKAVGNGVGTIVDLTVLGLGRYIPRVQKVADRTSANIIAATGFYTYNDLPVYWHLRPKRDGGADPLTTMFVRDVVDGIGDTGVKAGILKCATDWAGVTPAVERILRAVAQAHRETGVPISTHTGEDIGMYGADQQRIFAEEGVDLTRVVIGHASAAPLDVLLDFVDKGSFVGIDHLGATNVPGFPDDDERLRNVVALCERGYASHVVLSHDASCWQHHTEPMDLPDHHFSHIPTKIVPNLLDRGVSQKDIDTMLIDNPRRILAHQGPY